MNATLMRNMTDGELLQQLGTIRHQSPVIGELCVRLEKAIEPEILQRLGCPVCQAALSAEYDDCAGTITLRVEI